tara:strand:+ start:319 stop:495 length:177 start_codon:yes stop_codon:yes gene_type:complete
MTTDAAPAPEGPLLGSRIPGGEDALNQASFRERALKAGFSEAEVEALISIYGKAEGRS